MFLLTRHYFLFSCTDIIKGWILFKNSFDKKPIPLQKSVNNYFGVIVIYVSKTKHLIS